MKQKSKRYLLRRRYYYAAPIPEWTPWEVLGIYRSRKQAEKYWASYQESDYIAWEDDVEYEVEEID